MESWELQLALGSIALISAKSSEFFLRTKALNHSTVFSVTAEDPTVKHKGTRNALLHLKYIFLLEEKFFLYQRSYSTYSRNRVSPIKFNFTKVKCFGETVSSDD